MEAFGTVAAILAVLQLAGKLVVYGNTYIENEKEMPQILRKLVDELVSLSGILFILKDQYESNGQDQGRLCALDVLNKPGGLLNKCHDTLQAVELRLGEYGKRSIKGILIGQFKDQKIQEYIKDLKLSKRILMLALSTDQLKLSRAIENYAKTVHEDVQVVLKGQKVISDKIDTNFEEFRQDARSRLSKEESKQEEKSRAKLLGWISSVECESNHRAAIRLRQEGTGLWFTEGIEFEKWENGSTPLLWLYGLAGAGKSVLASSIIEKILQKHGHTPNDIGIAYFYFDFRVDEKQKPVYMAGSLIKQLLEGLERFSVEISSFYKRQSQRRHDFDLRDALELLPIVANQLSRVIFVVDGLDECNDRTTLLGTIRDLLGLRIRNFSLLFTSRDEYDIKIALKALSFSPVPIQTVHVTPDIALFVTENLKKDPHLGRLPQELKDLINERLVEGAQGMFRWVKCQFDQLRNLRRALEIKIALDSLPPDLDETYERILLSVSPGYKEIVRRTLQFLSYATRAVTLHEVAEAVVIEADQATLDLDLRFTQPEELLGLCGSFVTEIGDFIVLAHYSVKEYLISPRICKGPASSFFVTEARANLEICHVCLRYLNFEVFKTGSCQTTEALTTRLASYPLLKYAARQWYHHTQTGEDFEPQILDLATSIWSAQLNSSYLSWLQVYRSSWDSLADVGDGHEALTIYFPALWGLSSLVRVLLEAQAPVNCLSGGGKLLVAAVLSGSETVVRMLLEAGVDPNVGGGDGHLPLQEAVTFRSTDIVETLLRAGASVRVCGGDRFFPLNTAIGNGSEEIVRILLRAGADINARHKSGFTPLLKAIFSGSEPMVQILLHFGADTTPRDGDLCSLLEAAEKYGSEMLVRMLRDPETHRSARGGCIDCATELHELSLTVSPSKRYSSGPHLRLPATCSLPRSSVGDRFIWFLQVFLFYCVFS